MPSTTKSRFEDFELHEGVQEGLRELGFEHPTPIQEQALPHALEGRDVLGKAETGTGKTLAFGLPLLSRIDPQRTAAQALVLLPTRELAQQVAENLEPIAKHRGLKVALLYGGEKVRFQRSRIPGRQVIVGTPGRILDLLQEGYLHLEWVEVFVLDEFDRMLDMGFIDDVKKIVERIPDERQTLLFSATVPSIIRNLVDDLLDEPAVVEISRGLRTAKGVEQRALRVRPADRLEVLLRMLETGIAEADSDSTFLVFCNTRRAVGELDRELWGRGLPAAALSGDYEQSRRFMVMESFRERRVRILVATDVASRGLDVDHVGHVINYDVPMEPEDYVHRIGRTARAGRSGVVTTFVVPGQNKAFQRILDLLPGEVRVGSVSLRGGERRAIDSTARESAERGRGGYGSDRGRGRGGPSRGGGRGGSGPRGDRGGRGGSDRGRDRRR